jgi:hypothetical protein
MLDLNECQKVSSDVVVDKRASRSSADNLKPTDGTLPTPPVARAAPSGVFAVMPFCESMSGEPRLEKRTELQL